MPQPGLHSFNRNVRGYAQTKANFMFSCDSFRGGRLRISANYSQAVFWHNRNGGLYADKLFVCKFAAKHTNISTGLILFIRSFIKIVITDFIYLK